MKATDRELPLRYKLHVLASDGKWEDYTAVTVNVVNKNDEAPVFTVNEYYGSITEELDGSPVFVLQVQFWMNNLPWIFSLFPISLLTQNGVFVFRLCLFIVKLVRSSISTHVRRESLLF